MTTTVTTRRIGVAQIRSSAARFGIVFALGALVVALQLQSSTFLTTSNLFNLGEQWAPVGVMAIGMTFVLIGGGFDLSVGATFAFSATLGASLLTSHSTGYSVLVAIGLGVAVGLVNGLLVTRININPLIATLGMGQVVRGLGLVYSSGGTYNTDNSFIDTLGSGSIGEVPVSFLVMVVLGVILAVVLARSGFGRSVYAVGGNVQASYLAGIRVDRVRILTYVISGACASLAGLMYLGRVGSAQASAGTGIELQVIAAVLIGGVSIAGGEGAVWRAAVGVSVLAVLQNFFNQANVDSFWQSVVQGAIILLAVGLDSFGKRPHPRPSRLLRLIRRARAGRRRPADDQSRDGDPSPVPSEVTDLTDASTVPSEVHAIGSPRG